MPYLHKANSKYALWLGHACLLLALWLVLKPLSDKKLHPYRSHDWTSVIWADKAGYYMHLPATFIYRWDGTQIPADLPDKAGNGFSVDPTSALIRNKYPVGVSYFEAPFFLYTHYVSNAGKTGLTGLESEYQQAVARAGVFWGIVGIGLLALALVRLSGNFWMGWFCALTVFFGTNLFYYSVLHPGFSHSYSFLLFSGLLLAVPWEIAEPKPKHLVWAGLLVGLIFATRQLNVGFALLYLGFVFLNNRKRFSRRIFTITSVGLGLGLGFMAVFPQLLYWKYAFGSWLAYSYQGEGFTNYLSPDWRMTFLSVNNGLFIYTPIWALFLLFPLFFVRKQPLLARMLWAIFATQIYLCASWWAPGFGCCLGHRIFVDLLPFAALALAACLKTLQQANRKILSLTAWAALVVVLVGCTYFTLGLSHRFGGCWNYDYYDYATFYDKLVSPEKP